MIGHVVRTVAFADEEFEADSDAVVLRDAFDPVEATDGVLGSLLVGHAVSVSGKRYYIGNFILCGKGNVLAQVDLDGGVVFEFVHGAFDGAGTGVSHGADHSVAERDGVFLWLKEVDSGEAYVSWRGAEFLSREL